MGIILGLIALYFPRILMLVLFFLTNWFQGAIDDLIYLILGFIFAPVATLWYSVVIHYFGGRWDAITIVGMVIALAIDFGAFSSGRKRYA